MKYLKGLCFTITVFCICFWGSNFASLAASAPQKADYTEAGLEYYIHSGQQTAAVKIQNKKSHIEIPETVQIKGKSYKITEVKSTAIRHDTVVMNKKASAFLKITQNICPLLRVYFLKTVKY